MIVQNISCGKCKAPFKHSGNYLDVIGSPFFVCEQCGSANMHKEITEWELHPPMRKFAFFFLNTIFCTVYSVMLAVLLLKVMEAIGWIDPRPGMTILLRLFYVSLVIVFALWLRSFLKKVQASRHRMKDSIYTNTLRALNILKS